MQNQPTGYVDQAASHLLGPRGQLGLLLLLLFLTFSVLVANPKKLLYTVANPARGLLNREKRTKEKVWQQGGGGWVSVSDIGRVGKKMVLRSIPIYFLSTIVHDLKPKFASLFRSCFVLEDQT